MQTRKFYLENLGCANCAAKIEAAINRLPGVEATLTFATRQLAVTAEDPEALLPEMGRIADRIEPGVRIVDQEPHCHGNCHCGHEHHAHHHEHDHGDGEEPVWPLWSGAVAFAAALVLEHLGLSFRGIGYSWLPSILGYLLLGLPVLKTAGKNLLRGHVFDENFLMSLATLGAFAISEAPEALGVMLFYRLGEFFEEKAVARSRSQIMEAVDLRPQTVTLADGTVIPAGQARPGQVMLVRPGDRIGLDGIVRSGESRVDTAPITGEPVPVSLGPGDPAVSGCVNLSGQLLVEIQKPLSESMVTRILRAVESAAAGKPRIDRFITRFCKIYTPVVVLGAVAVAVIPSLITGNWNYWVYTALSFLVMSCPCALVLSVPLAFFSGIGRAGRKGILFKGGASIEALANVRVVAMDKTGTLTKGTLALTHSPGQALLRLCAGLEQSSNHPVAQSLVAAAREQGLELPQAQAVEELSGMGLKGKVENREILCGNTRLLERFAISYPENIPEGAVLMAVDGAWAGYFALEDQLKPTARQAVESLHKMGLQTAMLTGDTQAGARHIAQSCGIGHVFWRLLPEDKLTHLQKLRAEHGPAMFVGDGINDAPVLAGADVGAAMGSGADAAIEAADVVYMTADPLAIGESLQIARRTRSIAWQNVVFALAVKAAVMALGLCGAANMWLAVFADSGVALLCVLNSIRQLYRK